MSATSEDRLERLRDEAVARAERIPDAPVRDPRGGVTTVGTLVTDGARVRASVLAEREAGSEEHRRISGGQRAALRLLPLLDGLVMFWFLIGVLNVDLREPDATMLVALALALLCTVAVAAWVGTVGRHLRGWKDADGNPVWVATDGTCRGMLVLTGIAVSMLGVLMYVRVADEVYQATGVGGAGASVVAVVLAIAVVLVNLYVLYLSFADGSSRTTDADRLARAVRPHLRRRARELARADRLTARIASVRRADERLDRRRTPPRISPRISR